jgi:hypothetical protein
MTETLYRIEELYTNGWGLIDPSAQKLTREECSNRLNSYLSDGYNPNRIRVALDASE